MKLSLLLGGVFIGAALGLMVGAAIVEIPADRSGERKYPVFFSMILGITGVGVARAAWNRPGR